ncbi:HAD family hydrolase [Paenibacillus xanthanilyticus]|uniref:HAD family hydrolase n=1 Tax=Paenibacillus xanthanilyticus TaxID=1783531 RepID=A0ABV8K689_9BACL
MKVRYIWFDLGYTLVYQDREKVYRDYLLAQGIDIPLARIEEAYHLADKKFMRQYPGALGQEWDSFFPWYLGMLNYSLGVRFPLAEQAAALKAGERRQGPRWRAYPFAPGVLQWLKERSYGIGLISNWDQSARTVLNETGLARYLDHVVISSEVQVSKPDERIFRLAAEIAGARPEQCLYVGDNYYDDVVGSARAGMAACLVNRFGLLGIEELPAVTRIDSVAELPRLLAHAGDSRPLIQPERRNVN